ncbi:MAG: T9SS type A sorting domain-containing protein, partial [Ferruginibacter sp.]|nr:T9SS type A sorting domain-containing protein [Cytophagales bacterium]
TVSVTGPCGEGVISEAFGLTITATQPALAGEVVLHPNPATDQVTLQLPAGTGAQGARLLDVNGKLVGWLPAQKEGQAVFSTRHLSRGVYLLEIRTSRGPVRKKLLIQ